MAEHSIDRLAESMYGKGDSPSNLGGTAVPARASGSGEGRPEVGDDERAARLYSAASFHREAARQLERDSLAQLATPDEARATAERFVPVATRYDMSIEDGRRVAEAMAKVVRKLPSEDELRKWGAESEEWLLGEYGEGAGQALRDATTMLKSDPAFKAELDRTGLGSHPYVVRALVKRAVALRREAGRR